MNSLIPWKRRDRRDEALTVDDRWLDSVWENPFREMWPLSSRSIAPPMPSVDVSESKNEVTVRAEIPGMSEKNIELTWHDGILRLRGEKKHEREEKNHDRYYRESSYGCFCRDIPVGDEVDWKGAQAKYRHGVLTVKLPKTQSLRKAIGIKVN